MLVSLTIIPLQPANVNYAIFVLFMDAPVPFSERVFEMLCTSSFLGMDPICCAFAI